MRLSACEIEALRLLSLELSIEDIIHAAMIGFTAEDDSRLAEDKSNLCRLALKLMKTE